MDDQVGREGGREGAREGGREDAEKNPGQAEPLRARLGGRGKRKRGEKMGEGKLTWRVTTSGFHRVTSSRTFSRR